MKFEDAFDRLLGSEGGYSFNSMDPGGETMWGVTARVARANGYLGEMRSMPVPTAQAIYRKLYWAPIQGDQLPDPIAFLVFDAAVNSGVAQSVKWVQRAVGVKEDGVLGPHTLSEVIKADPKTLAVRLCALRLDLMTSLPTWGAFGKGWTRRIVANMEYAASVLV